MGAFVVDQSVMEECKSFADGDSDMQSKERCHRATLWAMHLLPQVASRTVFEAHQSPSKRAELALEQMDEVCVASTVHQWPVGKSSRFTWQTRLVLVLDGLDDSKLPWAAFALHEFDFTFSRIEALHNLECVLQLNTPAGGAERQFVDEVAGRHVGVVLVFDLMIVSGKMI
jgi:hypothetical protein